MAVIPVQERIAVLKGNEGWFGRAPGTFQDAVLSGCEWVEYRAGEAVYHASGAQVDLFGIVDGSIELYSRFGEGDNPLLHLLHEGVWIGYGPVMSGQPPRMAAVARVDTLLARLPSRTAHELLSRHPEWWRVLATGAIEYGDIALSAYIDSLITDTDRRCACTLLRVTGLRPPRRSRPERTEVPLTQEELAALVRVSRTTLLQTLRRFEQRGLVEQRYKVLRIADVAGLKAVAAGR